MKKVIMIVVILMLMTGSTMAFVMKTQPLGWNGWAWGTPLKDVLGWLSYGGALEIPQKSYSGEIAIPQLTDPEAKLYIRQGEPKDYFSKNKPPITWGEIYYIFKEERLQAVLLVGRDAEPAVRADTYYGLNALNYWGENGEKIKGPLREGSLRRYEYIFGEGEITSYIRMLYPLGIMTDHHYVIVGTSSAVNEWINKIRATIPAPSK